MTKNRDLKLLVRKRMEKTGESYTTALRHVENAPSSRKLNAPQTAAIEDSAEVNARPTVSPPPPVRDELRGWRRVCEQGMPEDYEIRIDPTQGYRSSSSALIRSRTDNTDSATKLMQHFLAHNYRGQRLRLSAWIKSEGLTGTCRLWMEHDENMRRLISATSQPIMGTVEWTRREVVLDVDPQATLILIGFLLNGEGAAWLADVEVESVGNDVPTTANRNIPAQPRNLNFLE